MSVIILKRWHKSLDKAHPFLILDDKNNTFKLIKRNDTIDNEVNGWFGKYENRFFCLYKKKDTSIFFISCGDVCIDLSEAITLKHEVNLLYRKLIVEKEGKPLFIFRYRSFIWYLLNRPFELMDLVFDDWWGLECDLPGFLFSTLSNKGTEGLLETLEKQQSVGNS